MVQRRIHLPRLVVPTGDMHVVRDDGHDMPPGQGPENLHRLPDDGVRLVADRVLESEPERTRPPYERLHIALVIPDIKLYGLLRQHAYLLSPPDWPGKVMLHIIAKGPKDEETGVLLRYLARESELATSHEAKLLYPEDIELGWSE